jgi:hypothetical protein
LAISDVLGAAQHFLKQQIFNPGIGSLPTLSNRPNDTFTFYYPFSLVLSSTVLQG